ncbi:MAG: NUDIX hydrolase [Phycisphaeraceae bacterium]|nr:NUDIX hydrolase [Phycisphaeraceae bacterium]
MNDSLPYTVGVLCYLYNASGQALLLHRSQEPNRGMHSPIGGKVHTAEGENPAVAALREIHEEVELELRPEDLRLAGLVTETAYLRRGHWQLYLYEVMRPVEVQRMSFKEGTLGWHDPAELMNLNIPETDRRVIYPTYLKFRNSGAFFHVHIDCTADPLTWTLEHPREGG